ncbi:MAG: type II toxin-antitoxin system VapC family toxin [Actinobacteria bacterium]|nr:type II toxin-antitoxin system VapC family toxin [Actinomycetota bacterium]MCA1720264.1 type II toxin-antitoxin system VapC family toxin [Actinomycetota bacterium]
MTTVVDASVVVDWVAPGLIPTSRALALLDQLADADEPLAAPRLLLHEVGNALLTGVRRDRWSGAQADAAYAHLRRLPVALLDEAADADRAYELSRRYDEHPAYDMVYLALAQRLGARLVTADERLLARVGHLPEVSGV